MLWEIPHSTTYAVISMLGTRSLVAVGFVRRGHVLDEGFGGLSALRSGGVGGAVVVDGDADVIGGEAGGGEFAEQVHEERRDEQVAGCSWGEVEGEADPHG